MCAGRKNRAPKGTKPLDSLKCFSCGWGHKWEGEAPALVSLSHAGVNYVLF